MATAGNSAAGSACAKLPPTVPLFLIWGWATWRRAWKHYNDSVNEFQQSLNNGTLKTLFPCKKESIYFSSRFKDTFDGHIDSWGYIWLYSRLFQGGIAIHPNVNLIQYIGFSEDATHTRFASKEIVDQSSGEITFPLKHPVDTNPDREADINIFSKVHCPNILLFQLSRAVKPIKRIFFGNKT